MNDQLVSRRSMLKTATLGTVAAAALAGTAASASAVPADYTFADTVAWDAEYDVVVMGMGFAGLVAAEAAADEGVSVLLVEKANKAEAGGNSRVCGQQIAYGYGDVENAFTYYKALSCDRDISDEMLHTFVEGMVNSAELLSERYDLDREKFVDMRVNPTVPQLKMFAPEYPELPGSDKIAVMAASESTSGGFENNRKMAANYLNLVDYAPQGTLHNTGDAHRMCMEIGARMWHMDVWEGSAAALGTSLYVPEGSIAINLVGIGLNSLNTGAMA